MKKSTKVRILAIFGFLAMSVVFAHVAAYIEHAYMEEWFGAPSFITSLFFTGAFFVTAFVMIFEGGGLFDYLDKDDNKKKGIFQ